MIRRARLVQLRNRLPVVLALDRYGSARSRANRRRPFDRCGRGVASLACKPGTELTGAGRGKDIWQALPTGLTGCGDPLEVELADRRKQ